MPILELSSVSSMFTEAGALAAPVAEVATEFQTTEMGHSLVEILPFCRDMLGSAVADATRRSTESSGNYRQLCHAAMLGLRVFLLRTQHGQPHSGSTRGGATLAGSGCS